MTEDRGQAGQAADIAAAGSTRAVAARRTAQRAREEATVASTKAAEGSAQPVSPDDDELSENLLRDYEPGQVPNSFVRPVRPLVRLSPI